MVKYILFTNIDEAQKELWSLSNEMIRDFAPEMKIGERILFSNSRGFSYELEVKSVTYSVEKDFFKKEIELGIPSWYLGSLQDWIGWKKRNWNK